MYLSRCQSSPFCSYLTEGETAQRELCFYTFRENTVAWTVFPEREKRYAEIQPFLNITDSVAENRKTGPGRDLPHVRS